MVAEEVNGSLPPLFPLAGSKFRQRKNILPILARYNRTLYVEPFCGAGGLFFGKPQESAEILIDPPYTYESKHGKPERLYCGLNVDADELVETLRSLRGSFVLSCYDAPVFEPLQARAHKFQFSARTTTARNYQSGTEFERVETVFASRFTR